MWIFDDIAQMLMAVGLLLAVVDVMFLGFATFFLTLIGLATLTTGVLVLTGVLSEQWTQIAISIAGFSAVYIVLLWKPLKRLQKQGGEVNKVSSDLIGHSFTLTESVSPSSAGNYFYSGIQWQVESTEELAAGRRVVVTDVQVGVMTVKAATE